MIDHKYLDQRNEARAAAKQKAYVRYSMVEIDGEQKNHASALSDYSCSGLRMVCHEPIPVGQVLKFSVVIDELNKSYRLLGQIRWCLEVDEIPTYHAGVSLVEDDSADLVSWLNDCQH